jgi:hypothetical protein
MKKQRKHYTPDEKAAVLRRHLLDKEPISKVCDELGLQSTVFYRWQKEFFENGQWPSSRRGHPEARPRIISDNGPQFIARDFKEFIRISGMTHARTSPYYHQSNGKIERWHKSLKGECIRPGTPLSLEDARRLVDG